MCARTIFSESIMIRLVNRVGDRRQTPLEKLALVVRLNGEAEQVLEG